MSGVLELVDVAIQQLRSICDADHKFVTEFRDVCSSENPALIIESAEAALGTVSHESKYVIHFVIGRERHRLAMERLYHQLKKTPATDANGPAAWAKVFLQIPEAHSSLASLRLAERLKPGFTPTLFYLAAWYEVAWCLTEGLAVAELICRQLPKVARGHWWLGKFHLELKHFHLALDALRIADELDGSDPNNSFQLGCAHEGLGNWQTAEMEFETAIALQHPFLQNCYFHLGDVLCKRDNYLDALGAYGKAETHGWPSNECNQRIAECIFKLSKQ